MKISTVILLASVGGVAFGLGSAGLKIRMSPWDGDPGGSGDPRELAGPEAGSLAPAVQIDRVEYDFGLVDVATEVSHRFRVFNNGRSDLELSPAGTSCGCTVSEISRDSVPRAESADITLTRREGGDAGPFRHTATIFTNDMRRPRLVLTILGRSVTAIEAYPSDLVFTGVSTHEETVGEVSLYCYLDEQLEIRGYDLLEPGHAGQFEVTFGPLSAEQLQEELDAASGLRMQVVVKSGLPLGPFRQRIRLRTNLESAPEIEIPVRGVVRGDISIIGKGFDSNDQRLQIGPVKGPEGARRDIWLMVRGKHHQASFEVVSVFPDFLRAELGPPEPIEGGRIDVTRTPLRIEIPKGRGPADFGSRRQGKRGEIVIRTTHPDVPEIRLGVSFSIEG